MSKTQVQLPESQVNNLYSQFEKEAIDFAKNDRGKNKDNLSLDDSPIFISSSGNESLTISFHEFCLRLKEIHNIQMTYKDSSFKVENTDFSQEYKNQLEREAGKLVSKGGVDYSEWLSFEYDNIIRTEDNEKIFIELFDSLSERYLVNPLEFFKTHLSLEDEEVSQLMYTLSNKVNYLQILDTVSKYGKECSHELFVENSKKYLKNDLDFIKSLYNDKHKAEEILKTADVDSDGRINYEEFLYIISLVNEVLEPNV